MFHTCHALQDVRINKLLGFQQIFFLKHLRDNNNTISIIKDSKGLLQIKTYYNNYISNIFFSFQVLITYHNNKIILLQNIILFSIIFVTDKCILYLFIIVIIYLPYLISWYFRGDFNSGYYCLILTGS